MIRGQKTGKEGEISNTKARLYIATNYSHWSLENGISFLHLLKGVNECEQGEVRRVIVRKRLFSCCL